MFDLLTKQMEEPEEKALLPLFSDALETTDILCVEVNGQTPSFSPLSTETPRHYYVQPLISLGSAMKDLRMIGYGGDPVFQKLASASLFIFICSIVIDSGVCGALALMEYTGESVIPALFAFLILFFVRTVLTFINVYVLYKMYCRYTHYVGHIASIMHNVDRTLQGRQQQQHNRK